MELQTCKSCAQTGSGKYCSACGQQYDTRRISVKSLLHDVFHLFTHVERGFLYTLKQLIVQPGTMQREYIEGIRSRYQKPFSMFIICASVNALLRYWLFAYLGETGQAVYFHEYQILMFILLMPVFTCINWLFFYRSAYNYAETGVLQLYLFGFILLAATLISFLELIWHTLDTAWVELPIFSIYAVFTFLNFYKNSTRIPVVLKSMAVIFIVFVLVQYSEELALYLLGGK